MANLVHIAEVGVLLFVAFSVSWVIGYGLHRLTARKPVSAAIPAERLAAVTAALVPDEAALVKAPVVDPVHNAPPPRAVEMPEESIKALDDLSKIPLVPTLPPLLASEPIILAVDPTPATVPSPTAEATTPAQPVEVVPPAVMPLDEGAALYETEVTPASAPVPDLQPLAEVPAPRPAEPVPPLAPAMPTSRAGMAYAGALHGRPSSPLARPAEQPVGSRTLAAEAATSTTSVPDDVTSLRAVAPAIIAEPVQAKAAEPVTHIPPETLQVPPVSVAIVPLVTLAVPPPVPAPEPTPEPAPVLAATVEPSVAVAPAPTPPRPVYDEDAAMRAIEGGWSRRASRALPDAPELIDVSAAVAKAQSAVQQVLVQSGIDPEQVSDRAKPAGTARPRDNSGDDLKRIAGISPLDEQTLNNLGIYRFEQITAWDPTEILWLENHAFARGRIAAEDWQGKARTLLANRKTA